VSAGWKSDLPPCVTAFASSSSAGELLNSASYFQPPEPSILPLLATGLVSLVGEQRATLFPLSVINWSECVSRRQIMSKFVPRESGGDETQVQKMVIGGRDGPTIQPQP